MKDLFKLILGVLASLFKSRAKLEAEILVLRQQINVLRRRAPKRPHLNNTDRFLFVWLYHRFPSVLGAIAIVRPETIIRLRLIAAENFSILASSRLRGRQSSNDLVDLKQNSLLNGTGKFYEGTGKLNARTGNLNRV